MMQHRYIRTLLFPALVLFLASCSVGKNFRRPQTNLPQNFRNAPETKDSSSVADLAWKDFFSDTTLQGMISNTIVRNFDMRLALKNIESANQTLKQSRAAFAPDLNFNISAASNRPSGSSLNGISLSNFLGTTHIEDFNTGVSLSWEIDIWGKMRRQKEAAQADYIQSAEGVRAVQTSLVSSVATGYYNLLMLDAQLAIARRNLQLNDSILQMTQLRKDVGQTTSLGVQLVEAQKQAAALLIPQLEQRIVIQENALRLLSGDQPSAVDRSTRLRDVLLSDSLAAGFPLGILSRRPDVKASEMRVKAANARAGVAQASMYPSLVINLGAGLNSFTAGNWFNIPGSLFGTFFGGLTQPLFNRRRLKTQFELAKIERDKSIIEFEKTVLTAVTEVSDALVKVEKLKQQQQIAEARVKTLQGALTDARLLFQTGLADYLEVITAQGNLLQGELEASAITCNLYLAKIELYRALGGGWK